MKNEFVVKTTSEIGELIRLARKDVHLTQLEISGLLNCGNRFIVDAENGKSTIQTQKLIDLLGLVGFEVVVRRK